MYCKRTMRHCTAPHTRRRGDPCLLPTVEDNETRAHHAPWMSVADRPLVGPGQIIEGNHCCDEWTIMVEYVVVRRKCFGKPYQLPLSFTPRSEDGRSQISDSYGGLYFMLRVETRLLCGFELETILMRKGEVGRGGVRCRANRSKGGHKL